MRRRSRLAFEEFASHLPAIHGDYQPALFTEFGDAADELVKESWLAFDFSPDCMTWGCWVCKNYLKPNELTLEKHKIAVMAMDDSAAFVITKLERHHNQSMHKKAVERLLDG